MWVVYRGEVRGVRTSVEGDPGIYYIENNYMFRPFSLPIFRLINEKKLINNYTPLMWAVYSGEVRGVRTSVEGDPGIYYIKNNYMFRPFSLPIFRLINEKN